MKENKIENTVLKNDTEAKATPIPNYVPNVPNIENLTKKENDKFYIGPDKIGKTPEVINAPNLNNAETIIVGGAVPSNNFYGDCLNSLPESENPFAKEYKELTSTVSEKILNKNELEVLYSKMKDYANENPDSVFAIAFATDNPLSSFAKANPDCVLKGDDKSEFIKENRKEQINEKTNNIIKKTFKLGDKKLDNDFSKTYGGINRSDELRTLTKTMDKAVREDQAMMMEMNGDIQLLLDPNKDGGLDVYVVNGKETELFASFDQDGKTNDSNIQEKLAFLANNLEIDNDSIFENITDYAKDSKINSSEKSKITSTFNKLANNLTDKIKDVLNKNNDDKTM